MGIIGVGLVRARLDIDGNGKPTLRARSGRSVGPAGCGLEVGIVVVIVEACFVGVA